MSSEFEENFGQLDVGPTHPLNPKDPARSLYSIHNRARRFDLRGDTAIDVRTGEVAFKATKDGKIALPNGKTLPAPKLVAVPKPVDTAAKLYGEKPSKPQWFGTPKPKPPAVSETQAMADRLYGKGRR